MLNVHYKSERQDWETPQDFFDRLNEEFDFTIDAAASPENAKCERFWTYRENGLAQSWEGERVWCNPPYGREIGRWIDKAIGANADVSVLLIPAKTETRWWAKFWNYETQRPIEGCEVRFVFGRIQYGNSGINAPFPNAVVIFRRSDSRGGKTIFPALGKG